MRAIAIAIVAVSAPAGAVEVATGLQLGYGRRLGEGAEGLAILGARADLLFGRDAFDDDVAAGMHLGFSAPDPFHEAQGDAGFSALFEIVDAWPIVVSAGAFAGTGAAEAGLLGRIFWGVRPHNDFHFYVVTVGLFVEARAALVGAEATDVAVGIHVDGYALLWPFVILYESIRGGPP